VLRPSSLRAALAGLVTVLCLTLAGLPTLAAPATTEDEATAGAAGTDPLEVHLTSISPVIPRSGDVEISGTVTNTTDADYTRINLHAFASSSPISDAHSLAASATIPPEQFVGERITTPGTFDTVDILAPGETSGFSLSIPVDDLGIAGTPGVYWIGVHALGDSTTPRDFSADGRARTFIPVLPTGRKHLEAAIVLPVRRAIAYAPDGSLRQPAQWARSLREGGRLHTLLKVAESPGGTTVTWLVDPAVLDALARLAAGNPPRSIAPDPRVPGQEPTDPAAEPGSGLLPPTDGAASDEAPALDDEFLARAAASWLERFTASTVERHVLALPYGDLDVSAAMRHDPQRFEQARARSNEVMVALGIPSVPALSPDNDVVTPEVLEAAPDETTVLLGDTAFAAPPDAPNSVVRTLGNKIVVTSSGAQMGGPAPTDAHDPLAMRQRLLSEAALRLLEGSRAPVVLTLPPDWHPDDATDLFSAFSEDWLDSVSVPDVAARPAVGQPRAALAYTDEDVDAELGAGNFTTARNLTDSATLLEQVLTLQTTIESQILDEALTTLSQARRTRPAFAMRTAAAAHGELTDLMGSVRVETATSVTLSSDSGPVGASVVNGLDQPVTVKVAAITDDDLEIRGNAERQLAPQARGSIRFDAVARRPGMHEIELQVTAPDGTPLGASARLPVRATQVSVLIWIVMATGAGLLFSAIGVRLWRRMRARRREPGTT
jgi:hypothetical protein